MKWKALCWIGLGGLAFDREEQRARKVGMATSRRDYKMKNSLLAVIALALAMAVSLPAYAQQLADPADWWMNGNFQKGLTMVAGPGQPIYARASSGSPWEEYGYLEVVSDEVVNVGVNTRLVHGTLILSGGRSVSVSGLVFIGKGLVHVVGPLAASHDFAELNLRTHNLVEAATGGMDFFRPPPPNNLGGDNECTDNCENEHINDYNTCQANIFAPCSADAGIDFAICSGACLFTPPPAQEVCLSGCTLKLVVDIAQCGTDTEPCEDDADVVYDSCVASCCLFQAPPEMTDQP